MGITELICIFGCCVLGIGVLLVVINTPLYSEKDKDSSMVKIGYFMMFFGTAIIIGIGVPIVITLLK